MVNRLPVYVKAHQKLFHYITIETSTKGDVYITHILEGNDYHLSRHSSGARALAMAPHLCFMRVKNKISTRSTGQL